MGLDLEPLALLTLCCLKDRALTKGVRGDE